MESYRGVSIVYEDNHLLVVVKPPNMPTQADDSGDADLHSTISTATRTRRRWEFLRLAMGSPR